MRIKNKDGNVIFESEDESLADTAIRAVLEGVSLRGANLAGANFEGVHFPSHTDLTDAILSHANLKGATLYNTMLERITCVETDFTGASLAGAIAREAVFARANMSGVDMAASNFTGARFTDTRLDNAVLGYVIGVDFLACEDVIDGGQDTRGFRYVGIRHDEGIYIAAGCRWFAIDEAIDHWCDPSYRAESRTVGAEREILLKLYMILEVAIARGWTLGRVDKNEAFGRIIDRIAKFTATEVG